MPLDLMDSLYLVFLMLHPAWAVTILGGGPERPLDAAAVRRSSEILFFMGTFLFLFAYIFASNANMDYVQRFQADGGNIQLAPDTRTERWLVTGRYASLLLVDLGLWIASHRAPKTGAGTAAAPALTLLSVALSVLAVPSFVSLDGYALLGWVALVPLMLVLLQETGRGNYPRAIGYGVLYGVLFTLIGNYWLGTFNLISLQAVGIIFLGFYLLFMALAVGLMALAPTGWPRVLVLPLLWTAFELARSSGFLGYPWLLVAHSQYRNLPLIQLAELGGVWLVSLVVLLVNALIAGLLLRIIERRYGFRRAWLRERGLRVGMLGLTVTIALAHLLGAVLLRAERPEQGSVRIALIQQNSDPRKHDYRRTLDSLIRLTDRGLAADPDLVVWSETAFVPNLRRWSQEDPRRFQLARLVNEVLDYQAGIDTWLLTGNDDYRRVMDEDGAEIRRDNFNAAVLFDDAGTRQDTYHKIRLVPFTEHFPYREQLPWVYEMLQSVDVTFWTPGTERTIFRHPKMDFATPICFEDVFPQELRRFADAGMEVIVNITNDYWSLQETAAQQHFVAALFRTVELRRPMVRSTASGVTSHIDVRGRIRATVPQYSEQYLVEEVAVPDLGSDPRRPVTLYQRWGEWVPVGAGVLALVLALSGRLRKKEFRQ